MQQKIILLLILGSLFAIELCYGNDVVSKEEREDEGEMTNEWAVELDTDDEDIAKRVAERYGYEYGGKIGALPRHFRFIRRKEENLLKGVQNDDESEGKIKHDYKRVLEKHPRVKWVEQQRVLVREKQQS